MTICLSKDYLTGTLDRIYLDASGNWQVVDYKTNRIVTHKVEQESLRYELQMQAYALMMQKIYPEQKKYSVSLYYLHPDKIFSQTFTDSGLLEIEHSFLEIIAQIKQTFPVT